jgi:small subunit ribosomal protein S6
MTATAKQIEEPRAREYETIYIMRSSVEPDEAERIGQRVREIVTARGGKLLRVDNWGRRRLAYPIKKATRGAFVYVKYVGLNDLVAEIERQLRLIDDVVRFQTVLVKERVRVEDYEVDGKDVEFQRLEQAEPEEEPELAARLGLIERPRGEREPFEREPDGFEGEEGDEVMGGGAETATEEES